MKMKTGLGVSTGDGEVFMEIRESVFRGKCKIFFNFFFKIMHICLGC